MNGTLKTVEEIFRETFKKSDLNISADTTSKDIPEWDSVTNVTLVVSIEERFGITFDLAELKDLRDVGKLVDLINKKVVSCEN